MRELSTLPWPRQAIIALALGIAAALLGPFGTATTLAPAARAAYWIPLIALGWVQFVATGAASDRISSLAARPLPVRIAAVVALAALPTALEVTAVNVVFLGQHQDFTSFLDTYWKCALIGTLILVPMHFIASRAVATAPPPSAETKTAAGAEPRFYGRIPDSIRGRLLALEMEDHYLRIHTASGSALILHRMSDAVTELAGVGGWRVHRSWWVAADAVKAVLREDGRTTLVLENGLAVPVSRSMWPRLRERLQPLLSA